MSSLPAFVVVIPIVGALAVLAGEIGGREVGWTLSVVTLLVQGVVASALAVEVTASGPVTYLLGGLPASVGIELVADRLAVPFVLLVVVTGLGGLSYLRRDGPTAPRFDALYLLLVAGLTGVCITGDAFNLYVFLEISGLSAYALVAAGDDAGAPVAALRYLLVGTIGASCYLFGVGYAYVGTGTLNVAGLATAFGQIGFASPLVVASFGLVFVGLAVKIALVPLHTWKPAAYADSPVGVAAVLAALVSTVATYALVRLLLSAYTVRFLTAVRAARPTMLALASASIVLGALLALVQTDVRRMLAYSGVAQFGVAVAGIAVANDLGTSGAVLQLVGHAVAKGGAFVAAGVLATGYDLRTVEEYAGAADRAPVACLALAVLALSLVGIPPTVGFFGKWYVALGALEAGWWPVAALVLASTLLSLTYFVRLVQRMFFESPADRLDRSTTDAGVSVGMVAPAVGAAGATVVLGVTAAAFVSYLDPTIAALLQP